MLDVKALIEKMDASLKDGLELQENGQAIFVGRENIQELLKTLKDKFGFVRLMDMTSVDYEDRYEIVYHLMNDDIELLAVKVRLSKDDYTIPSISSIWKAADVQEREIYDLMGIVFEGHGNLKRILNPDDFVGHPLRKSFKLEPVSRF
jgi:NADH-quinone oxidoreductase subunit C